MHKLEVERWIVHVQYNTRVDNKLTDEFGEKIDVR